MDLESQSDPYGRILRYLRSVPIVYLCGHRGSGKTILAQKALEELDKDLLYAYIDCRKLTTFTSILDDIAQELMTKLKCDELTKKYDRISSKDSFCHFIRELNKIQIKQFSHVVSSANKTEKSRKRTKRRTNTQSVYSSADGDTSEFIDPGKRITIALDHAESLKKANLTDILRYIFFLMDAVYSINLFIITFDNDLYECIKNESDRASISSKTNHIEQPPWTTNDLVKMICQEMPTKKQEIYEKFVRNTISCFSSMDDTGTNRYFNVLKRICQENFEDYLKIDDEQKNDNFAATYMLQRKKQLTKHKANHDDKKTNFTPSFFKTLLVAVYFAAHTTPIHDKSNWIDNQKRKITRARAFNKEDEAASAFTLERLLHIYSQLTGKSLGLNVKDKTNRQVSDAQDKVLEYLTILENTYLLHRCGGDLLDSDTRYRVVGELTRPDIENLAKQIDIKLSDFTGF